MKLFRRKKTARQSIKEAIDNLPAGICFFDKSGLLILSNRQMQRISHALTGHDLQMQSEIESWQYNAALPDPSGGESSSAFVKDVLILPDGTAWHFEKRTGTDGVKGFFTQYIASDVTELYQRKCELEEGIRLQQDVLRSMENISHNLAAMTRSEESLRLKMKIHNDLGAALNLARAYLADGCPEENREEFIRLQKSMSQVLLRESQSVEEDNPLKDLYQVAEGLGMNIQMENGHLLNHHLRRILSYALRECLTNTIRHAGGDTVCCHLSLENDRLVARLTNNGKVPEKKIVEGGGLSSLRQKLAQSAGTMKITSFPRFVMEITLPTSARAD